MMSCSYMQQQRDSHRAGEAPWRRKWGHMVLLHFQNLNIGQTNMGLEGVVKGLPGAIWRAGHASSHDQGAGNRRVFVLWAFIELEECLCAISIPGFMASSSTSPVAQMVKRLPAMQKTRVGSLGQEDPLEKEKATYSGILAWKIPWTQEPGRL